MENEILEKSFTVAGSARLELSNIRGSVDIHPGADGVITVKAEKQAATGDAKQTKIEMRQESDGSVIVRTRFPEDWLDLLFGAKPCKVDYVITAPRDCQLKVKGVSNSVLVEGFNGDASFKTVSGDVTVSALDGYLSFDAVSGKLKLSNLKGKLHLNTVSGDIKGSHLAGDVHLNTVSGGVDFDGSDLLSISASTVSGDLNVETPLAEGPYKFNAVSGDLTLKLPADTHCSAELQSMSGALSIRFPTTSVLHQNGRHLTDIQGGGVRVSLHSVSGNMEIIS
jgi:DUF4097 and DUF4098 domain-containing protein YvlB